MGFWSQFSQTFAPPEQPQTGKAGRASQPKTSKVAFGSDTTRQNWINPAYNLTHPSHEGRQKVWTA
jgi:hypothetical protein